MIEPWVYPALTATAVLTGFIDAIAGGGGLIMMPALLFSGASPIQALATNKLQSVFGTAVATRNYARAGLVELAGPQAGHGARLRRRDGRRPARPVDRRESCSA